MFEENLIYNILGVPFNASAEQIVSSYHNKILQCLKSPYSSIKQLQRIHLSYKILMTKTLRRKYDQKLTQLRKKTELIQQMQCYQLVKNFINSNIKVPNVFQMLEIEEEQETEEQQRSASTISNPQLNPILSSLKRPNPNGFPFSQSQEVLNESIKQLNHAKQKIGIIHKSKNIHKIRI